MCARLGQRRLRKSATGRLIIADSVEESFDKLDVKLVNQMKKMELKDGKKNTVSETERMVVTRVVFDAPLELVWKAWTDPKRL